MRLRPPERFNSFYESFSDLIFGTMAIFVLLMMVFLVLVNEGDVKKRKELEEQVVQAKETTARTQDQLKKVIEEFVKLDKAVRTKGLELVVAVDRTSSMAEGLRDLTETLNVFSSVITQYVPEYRLSIIAYHEDRTQYTVLPVMDVLPKDKDGGASQQRVEQFLGGVTPIGGAAPVEEAVEAGLSVHQQNASFGGVQVFMLIGDVGPFEVQANALPNQVRSDSVIAKMKAWTQGAATRKIVAVYADRGCRIIARCNLPDESKDFFRRACEVSSGARECASFVSEQMLVHLLRAIVIN